MRLISVYGFVVPILIGFLLIHLSWTDQRFIFKDALIKFSLSIGIGFGITSLCFMVWVLLLGPVNGFIPSAISELSLLIGLSFRTMRNARKNTPSPSRTHNTLVGFMTQPSMDKILLICAGVVLMMSASSFVSLSIKEPHGKWDAWAIWNMHARFLFRGDLDWRNLFSPAIAWTHSDYPLLLPGFVARCWKFVGKDTVWAPSFIAMCFTFGTVGVVISSLSMLKGKFEGLLGGLLLMGTASFIKQGAWQYADVPLSFFFCSSLALFSIVDSSYDDRKQLIPLAGLMSAFSAWTKNEGIVFLLSLIIARAIIIIRFKGFKAFAGEIVLLMRGILPVAIVLVYLKLRLAPPSVLFRGDLFLTVADATRFISIIKALGYEFLHFGFYIIGAIPLLLLVLFVSEIEIRKENIPSMLTALITLSFMLSSYFLAYLITQDNLEWLIDTTLMRFFVQLWPSAVLLVFLMVKPIKAAQVFRS